MLKEETSDIGKLVKGDLEHGEFASSPPLSSEPEVQSELVLAIEAKMTELGLNATQLALRIGFSKSKVSEILNRKRPLSKKMAKALFELDISGEVLFKALIEGDK
jgi:antitoxin component HigA of HigAB toxin-antitoxin module